MANLLSCLKSDQDKANYNKFIGHVSELDEDEDISNLLERRLSINNSNDTEKNF